MKVENLFQVIKNHKLKSQKVKKYQSIEKTFGKKEIERNLGENEKKEPKEEVIEKQKPCIAGWLFPLSY